MKLLGWSWRRAAPPRSWPNGARSVPLEGMPGLVRQLLVTCVIAALWLSPGLGHAWIETRVESSRTSIEVLPDGTATVRYQLGLDVRGAPLRSFTLDGVDADAAPLPDATLTRMKGGIANSRPLPVQVVASGGRLEINVPLKQGFRGRSFVLELGYRTHLLARGLIRHLPGGERSELMWLGPRFADGVDSVIVVVRTPAAAQPPYVVTEADGAPGGMANFGIVMSTLRRSNARDELELVRAHVARAEAITWRVALDRRLFPGAPGPSMSAAASTPQAGPTALTPIAPGRPFTLMSALPWLSLLGVCYGLLVWLKTWRVARAARVRGCRPRPFIPWRTACRSLVAGVCLSGAATSVVWLDLPTLAAVLLVLAAALAAQRPPEPSPELRGPGAWKPLDDAAFRMPPRPGVPGAWLDAGRLQGFLLLCAALAGTTWAAARWFETSPYHGACLLLGSSALLPLFCTGRLGEMPLDALSESHRFLTRALRRLRRDPELVVQLIGRVAAQGGELDELRLSVLPLRGLPGLLGVELGLEFQERIGGFCARPVVVVRAAEGSACQKALPRGLMWTRGRSTEERASVVKPMLPTLSMTVGLIQELLVVMAASDAGAAPTASKKATRSSGKGLSTAKPATRSSPLHAT